MKMYHNSEIIKNNEKFKLLLCNFYANQLAFKRKYFYRVYCNPLNCFYHEVFTTKS